jgi:hypothetical protein
MAHRSPGPAPQVQEREKFVRLIGKSVHYAPVISTPAQIAAVEAILTLDGLQVFAWGGRWRNAKDAMHSNSTSVPQNSPVESRLARAS